MTDRTATRLGVQQRDLAMEWRIQNRKDFYSGLIFIFFGILCAAVAGTYPLGEARRMGPGYFPSILGSILALLGLVISGRSLRGRRETIKAWAFRPVVLVLAAIAAFALLVDSLGLVLAALALVVISCLGSGEFRLREVTVLFLTLAILGIGLFVYGLELPFKVWP